MTESYEELWWFYGYWGFKTELAVELKVKEDNRRANQRVEVRIISMSISQVLSVNKSYKQPQKDKTARREWLCADDL